MVILGCFVWNAKDWPGPSALRNVRNTHQSTQQEENREAATSLPASPAVDLDLVVILRPVEASSAPEHVKQLPFFFSLAKTLFVLCYFIFMS